MDTKISFGFKKLSKKSAVIGLKPPEEKKVELIECLDGQSIKIKGHVEVEEKPLVIPMQGANKTLLDRIKDANDLKDRSLKKIQSKKKEEPVDTRPDSELTLDELAARKLIQDAKNYEVKKTAAKVMTIAIEDQLLLEGAQEPTMDDYEAVPISDYGYAMLRGMGWSEQLMKDKKKVVAPELRPKGMGLGAVISGQQASKIPRDKDGKELKLVKGAKAKIIAGKEKGNYCIVQGLDDDAGRIIVKLTLSGANLSLNEFMLFPVTNEEYAKSSKVLNNAKYEQYKKIKEESPAKRKKHAKREERSERSDDGDVEYVPNKNGTVELSSESEEEHENRDQQRRKDIASISRVRVKDEMMEESQRRGRSRSRTPERRSSKHHSRRRSRSRSRSSSRSPARNTRKYRSRSRSRSKSKAEKYKTLEKLKDVNSGSSSKSKKKDKTNKYSDESESDSDGNRRHKKSKSKKSKKHKKEKKHKKKSRNSDSNSDS